MKFKIKVYYRTGDSYSNYDTSCELDYAWQKLEIVEENLQRIKEHCEWYKWEHGYKFSNDPEPKKPDFVNPKSDRSIFLKLDDGAVFYYSCKWLGHFETPNYAKIMIDLPKVNL